MIYICLFMIGASLASFIQVIACRLPREESFIKGRSHCEYCFHQLDWFELIPIFSYLFLKGKCRYCKCKITVLSPVIECIGGLLCLQCVYRYGMSLQTWIVFFICLDLMLIALIDWQTMNIYLSTIIVFLSLTLFFRFIQGFLNTNILINSLSVSLPMLLLNVFVPESFGYGDIQLMFVAGMMLGWVYNLLAMAISIISATFYAGYLLLRKKVNRKGHIAFGPFLVFGIMTSLFYGPKLLIWYFRMFF